MKRRLLAWLTLSMLLCGCGSSTTSTSDLSHPGDKYAIIRLPNDEIVEGQCLEYSSFNDGVVKVKIGDTIYRVHSNNVAIIIDAPY